MLMREYRSAKQTPAAEHARPCTHCKIFHHDAIWIVSAARPAPRGVDAAESAVGSRKVVDAHVEAE